jgi:hypothetical protein
MKEDRVSEQQRQHPDKSFETELANLVGVVVANLQQVIDRNPDLPVQARTALVRAMWKAMPLADAAAVTAMRKAYEPWLYLPELSDPSASSPNGMPS